MEDFPPKEHVEVEEMRRRQARKAREKGARQEEGDGRDEHEEKEEEKNVWNRRADEVASDRDKKI